jgi:hypothetical protein
VSELGGEQLPRRPGEDDLAAVPAALRAQVDDPVRLLDHREVVLDDHHGVAAADHEAASTVRAAR